MKTYKKGISLIVLVITIIVLAILATTVIISLSNTNIIGEATNAVNKSNLQAYKEQAALAYAAWKADNKAATLTNVDELKDYGFDATTLTGSYGAVISNGVPKIVDVWDGTSYDTVFEGDGTEANPYKISSAAELAGLAKVVNETGLDQRKRNSYELTADIDLNNKTWIPIGNEYIMDVGRVGEDGNLYAVYFMWTDIFNGNNHTVFNLKVENQTHAGLFGIIYTGTVKNLYLDTGSVSGTNAGAIAGVMPAGTIANCQNIGTTVTTTDGFAGGIVSGGDLFTIENCVNYANVTGKYASGIGAGTSCCVVIKNCRNYGYVNGVAYASGLALGTTLSFSGNKILLTYVQNLPTITDSVNNGIVEGVQP